MMSLGQARISQLESNLKKSHEDNEKLKQLLADSDVRVMSIQKEFERQTGLMRDRIVTLESQSQVRFQPWSEAAQLPVQNSAVVKDDALRLPIASGPNLSPTRSGSELLKCTGDQREIHGKVQSPQEQLLQFSEEDIMKRIFGDESFITSPIRPSGSPILPKTHQRAVERIDCEGGFIGKLYARFEGTGTTQKFKERTQ